MAIIQTSIRQWMCQQTVVYLYRANCSICGKWLDPVCSNKLGSLHNPSAPVKETSCEGRCIQCGHIGKRNRYRGPVTPSLFGRLIWNMGLNNWGKTYHKVPDSCVISLTAVSTWGDRVVLRRKSSAPGCILTLMGNYSHLGVAWPARFHTSRNPRSLYV